MSVPDLIGAVGVSLLLMAYLFNVLKWVDAKSVSYLLLNAVGAGLACCSSWLISFVPFVILEGVWMLVSLVSLLRVLLGQKEQID